MTGPEIVELKELVGRWCEVGHDDLMPSEIKRLGDLACLMAEQVALHTLHDDGHTKRQSELSRRVEALEKRFEAADQERELMARRIEGLATR